VLRHYRLAANNERRQRSLFEQSFSRSAPRYSGCFPSLDFFAAAKNIPNIFPAIFVALSSRDTHMRIHSNHHHQSAQKKERKIVDNFLRVV
jgi:hypothetical protein